MAAQLLTRMLLPTLHPDREDLCALVGLVPRPAVDPVLESDQSLLGI